MGEASRHLDQAQDALTAIRLAVAQSVAATASGYTSEAATLFRSTMDQWGAEFNKIIGGLERMRGSLNSNRLQYEATLDQERQSVNQIAAQLNGNGSV
jgi:hypothetical protein